MIEIFGHSIGFVNMVFLILILLFIVTQGSWWIGRCYFPGHRICMSVHKNLPRWFEKEKRFLSLFETPSVFGFLCTFLLMGIISLNITLLAQIFELFVPSGQRHTFPFIGTYATFPLIVGLLYALVQVTLSTIRKMKKLRGEPTRSITGAIIITIIVEAGLNFYRAWLLTSGQQPVSPTLWDQVITFGGPILAGFLGIVVPWAEILLSPYAMLEFIQPVIKDVVVLVRLVIGTIFLGLTWIYFGFHDKKPVILPGPVSRLKSDIEKPDEDASMLRSIVDHVENLVSGLKYLPLDKTEFDKRINGLQNIIDKSELGGTNPNFHSIESKISAFNELIDNISNKRQLKESIRRTDKWVRSVYTDAEQAKCGIADLNDTSDRTPHHHRTWKEKHQECHNEFGRAKDLGQTLLQEVGPDSELERLWKEINSAIKGIAVRNGALAEAEIEELNELGAPPAGWDEHERKWNRSVVLPATREALSSIYSRLIGIRNTAGNYLKNLGALEKEFDELFAPPLQEADIEQIKTKLVTMDNRVRRIEKDIGDQLKDWQSEMRSKALRKGYVFLFLSLLLPRRKKL